LTLTVLFLGFLVSMEFKVMILMIDIKEIAWFWL